MRIVEVLENSPNSEQAITQDTIAKLLDVSPRTIYNWRKFSQQGPRKIGRPQHGEAIRRKAFWLVGRELRKQGYPGWRAIKAGLEQSIPDRLIQEYVRRFKLKRRRRVLKTKTKDRMHVQVMRPNVVWSMDSAHWPRRTEAQVIKDRATRKLLAVTFGPPVRQNDVLQLLQKMKLERGLPLVLATDNGSAFVNKAVSEYLRQEKVVHLRSLPRTPEHNSSVEVGIRELREQVGENPNMLVEACARLNESRLRASLGYITANKFDEQNSWQYNKVRDQFFRYCSSRITKEVQDAKNPREARMREREAIHASLQEMGWIKRWRGDQSIPTIRSEKVS
jgi:putative transposase